MNLLSDILSIKLIFRVCRFFRLLKFVCVMSKSKEQKEKPLPERIGEDRLTFRWGVKKGTINLYESFTLDGIRYSLFDNVYVWNNDQPEIGKLVRIMETENHEKKVEIVWFFRPRDIVNFLGNVKPLKKEVFLACGEGKGLSNVCALVISFCFFSISDNRSGIIVYQVSFCFLTCCVISCI